MNRMGGLWRKIPITHWTMLIGAIAIAGIPPFAGFFCKDEILGDAYKSGDYWVWIIGLTVAVMTAFYMWRLMGKTFYGDVPRRPGRGAEDPRVAVADDAAAGPAGHPVGDPGHRAHLGRPAARTPAAPGCSRAGSSRCSRRPRRTSTRRPAAFEIAGIDGALIIISVAAAAIGLVPRDLAVRLLPQRRSPARRRAGHGRQPRDPLPVPRLAEQVVVRRPQPPAVHRHRRPGRGGPVVVRPGHHRRHGQRHRRARPATPAAACAGSRPGRVQNYALGIAIGLLVMAGSFLVIVGQPR